MSWPEKMPVAWGSLEMAPGGTKGLRQHLVYMHSLVPPFPVWLPSPLSRAPA